MPKDRPSVNNIDSFTVVEYLQALRVVQRQELWQEPFLTMLRWQIRSEDMRANASDLALVMEMPVGQVDLIYGQAGKTLGSLLTGSPSEDLEKGWPFLAHGEYESGRFYWTLHTPLARAIDTLELLLERDETPAYIAALETIQKRRKLHDIRLKMLRHHYHALNHDVTSDELAALMGWGHMATVNVNYGNLGASFAEFLGPSPVTYDGSDKPMNVAHLVTFWHDGNGWHWVMRRGLRQALEVLKLVTPKTSEPVFTFQQARIFSESDPNSLGEVPNNSLYREGAVKTVTVNKYERDQAARKKCIQHHGPICKVCEVNLVDIYGPLAAGYIHVHHLRPLADIGAEYEVDPKLDLIPVCPNCHAMLHRNNPPLSVEELRARMQEAKSFE